MFQIRNSATTLQNVVTYDAVVRVENDELKLRPGMTASATFIVEDRRDALLVPNAALRFTPSDPKIAALAPVRAEGRGGRRRHEVVVVKAEFRFRLLEDGGFVGLSAQGGGECRANRSVHIEIEIVSELIEIAVVVKLVP